MTSGQEKGRIQPAAVRRLNTAIGRGGIANGHPVSAIPGLDLFCVAGSATRLLPAPPRQGRPRR
jgi:hypothetical protein